MLRMRNTKRRDCTDDAALAKAGRSRPRTRCPPARATGGVSPTGLDSGALPRPDRSAPAAGCMAVVADAGRWAFTGSAEAGWAASVEGDGARASTGRRRRPKAGRPAAALCARHTSHHRPIFLLRFRPAEGGLVCTAHRRLYQARVCHRLPAWQPVETVTNSCRRPRTGTLPWIIRTWRKPVEKVTNPCRRPHWQNRERDFGERPNVSTNCRACSHLWKPPDDGRCDSDRRQRLV